MMNRRSRIFRSMVLCAAIMVVAGAQSASAQLNDLEAFTTPLGVFAVPPNPVLNWSLDPGCSPGYIISGRGDGGDLKALANQMPPGTGTRMVRDLNPGPGSSTFQSMAHSGIDTIYHLFLPGDDGTGAGTEFCQVVSGLYPVLVMKNDINPGPGSSNPMHLWKQEPGAQAYIYFSADNGTNGREPWLSLTETNQTSNETMLRDINPGAGGSDPEGFNVAASTSARTVVFAANDGTNGREIWKTDGTEATTTMVKDINPGAASSNPQQMTQLVLNWASNNGPYDVRVFFTAEDGVNGRELWRTDGTAAGTFLVKDINAGAGSSNIANLTPANWVAGAVYQAKVFFSIGTELWSSRGTSGGADTILIKDIGAAPSNFTVVPNVSATTGYTLFFAAGNSLWKSNGTAEGTVVVQNFVAPPQNLMSFRNAVYFAADDGSGAGTELWKADNTSAVMLKDINPGAGSSTPMNMRVMGNLMFFSADNGVHGRELWKTDTTADGTVLVKDINPGPAGSDPSTGFRFEGSILFFTADDGTHGRELWQSDGFADFGQAHTGIGYKWNIGSLINSRDPGKIALVGTNQNVITIGATFDVPAQGGDGLSEAAHQVNHYIELTDGVDRAPLDITLVDCGDGNLPRPTAALTDGTYHNAIAFGMVAVLDQNPCDIDPRGPASPHVPFAYVPAIYDGLNWIPMDREHITPGLTSTTPSKTSLSQAPRSSNYLTVGLPPDLVAATSDPSSQKRYTWIRLEVWTDYIRAYWYSKNVEVVYVATVPRHYKGAFRALHIGNKAGIEAPYPYYFDSLSIVGGLSVNSMEPYAACCTQAGCIDVEGFDACSGGTMTKWRTCSDPATPKCCPVPWADTDWDGDVDMDDFAALQRCLTIGGGAVTSQCACLDRNGDNVISTAEINKFITCGTGAGVLATPGEAADCDSNP